MTKKRRASRPPFKRPFATQLDPDMSLSEKMARIRRRVQAKGYFNHKHPSIQIHTSDRLHNVSRRKLRRGDLMRLDSYARRTFTSQEIEQMWLALCRLLDFFGGVKTLCCRECTINVGTLNHWINIGRISPLGADIIHHIPEVPFTREELRPDMTREAWAGFDRKRAELYARRAMLAGLEDEGELEDEE